MIYCNSASGSLHCILVDMFLVSIICGRFLKAPLVGPKATLFDQKPPLLGPNAPLIGPKAVLVWPTMSVFFVK